MPRQLIRELMESPLYWRMTVVQRLALIRQIMGNGTGDNSSFRQRALFWIKTGDWV